MATTDTQYQIKRQIIDTYFHTAEKTPLFSHVQAEENVMKKFGKEAPTIGLALVGLPTLSSLASRSPQYKQAISQVRHPLLRKFISSPVAMLFPGLYIASVYASFRITSIVREEPSFTEYTNKSLTNKPQNIQLLFADYHRLQNYFRHPSQSSAIRDFLNSENLRARDFEKQELRQKFLYQLSDNLLMRGFRKEDANKPVLSTQKSVTNSPEEAEAKSMMMENHVENNKTYKTFEQIAKEKEQIPMQNSEKTDLDYQSNQLHDHYKPQKEVKEYVFEDPYEKRSRDKKRWD